MADLLAMMQVAAGGGVVEPGGLLVYSTGTKTGAASGFVSPYYDWVVPPNVRSICAVAIGGGGSGSGSIGGDGGSGGGAGALSYSNDITVSPGETLRIHAGLAGAASPENSAGYGGSASGIVRLSNSTEIL